MQRCIGRKGDGTMESKKRTGLFSLFFRMFRQVLAIHPVLFGLNYVVAAAAGILSSQGIIWLQKIYDTLFEAVRDGKIKDVIFMLFIWFGIKAAGELMTGLYNIMGEEHAMQTEKGLGKNINGKVGRLEPIMFESEETLNSIQRSYRGAGVGRNFVNEFLTGFFLYLPYFGTLFLYLYRQEKKLGLIILVIFAVTLLSQAVKSKFYVELEEETAGCQRKIKYYSGCINGRDMGKESRSLSICPFLTKKVKDALSEWNGYRKKQWKKGAATDLILAVMTFFSFVGIVLLMFYDLTKGVITVGLFAGIFCSVDSIFEMTEGFVSDCLEYGAALRGRIEGYLDFCRMPEKPASGIRLTKHGTVAAKNVSFRYPGSGRKAVDGVDLTIKEGETVAVVGENGSGKTTLVRLLAGIFLPMEGEVVHNGKSTVEYERFSFYQGMTGVFQNFGKYKISLLDNIRISDFREKIEKETERKELARLGLTVKEEIFPQDFETVLAPEYGGADLSGGQWNRIAIRRGLFRKHEMILLDEPTAAIDVMEEKRIYEQFIKMCKGKTALIVTHRLASTRLADQIIVMDQGRIVGFGKHEELLSTCRKYQEMWEIQKEVFFCT